MKEAYKSGDGRKIEGRRVLVDVERGRTVETWWVQGGEGGRIQVMLGKGRSIGVGVTCWRNDGVMVASTTVCCLLIGVLHGMGAGRTLLLTCNAQGRFAANTDLSVWCCYTVLCRKPRRLAGGLGGEGRAPRPPKKAGAVAGMLPPPPAPDPFDRYPMLPMMLPHFPTLFAACCCACMLHAVRLGRRVAGCDSHHHSHSARLWMSLMRQPSHPRLCLHTSHACQSALSASQRQHVQCTSCPQHNLHSQPPHHFRE